MTKTGEFDLDDTKDTMSMMRIVTFKISISLLDHQKIKKGGSRERFRDSVTRICAKSFEAYIHPKTYSGRRPLTLFGPTCTRVQRPKAAKTYLSLLKDYMYLQ